MVGGQAVNLWAIAYLEQGASDLRAGSLGSKDLDILADKKGLEYLKTVPGWSFTPNNLRNFTDMRQGFLQGTSEDGRKLLVEILHSVHGLEKEELGYVETIEHRGHPYRLLDPVVMLKAKAANVRGLKQDDDPPRHDREHLQLIARCVPSYLRDVHQRAVELPSLEKESLAVISRAFKTLQHRKTASGPSTPAARCSRQAARGTRAPWARPARCRACSCSTASTATSRRTSRRPS